MMADGIRILGSADFRTMRWKNGLGETTEIDRSSGGSDLADFDWRLSLARVEAAGPFSTFPGVDRTITVVEGRGMCLTFADGRRHQLQPLVPFSYDGGFPIDGTLTDGPVRDFNVMVRRSEWQSVTQIASAGCALAMSVPADIAFVIALGGGIVVDVTTAAGVTGSHRLAALDALRIDAAAALAVRPPADASAIVVLMRRWANRTDQQK